LPLRAQGGFSDNGGNSKTRRRPGTKFNLFDPRLQTKRPNPEDLELPEGDGWDEDNESVDWEEDETYPTQIPDPRPRE